MPRTGRSPEVWERILKAARRLFLASGYEGTSMDAVQREVGGSKATLYAHFPSKEALFTAACGGLEPRPFALQLSEGGPPARVLEAVALKALQACVSPWHARLHRLMAGRAESGSEAASEVAQAFFERSGGRALSDLAAWLRLQHRAGLLHCPRPVPSAELFLGMAQGLHAQRALFGLPAPGPAAQTAWARQAAQAFLRLHAPRS